MFHSILYSIYTDLLLTLLRVVYVSIFSFMEKILVSITIQYFRYANSVDKPHLDICIMYIIIT